MLAHPVEWKGKSARAFAAMLLTLFSGVCTATYAGYRLEAAWAANVRCNPPPAGTSCATLSFWGLSPTWFLAACIAGIAIGLLTAIVGWELHRRAFGLTRGSYAILVLALAGLIAYGGLGIGTAAGVAGSLLFATLRTTRSGAPSEWTGVLPVGVPAVKNPPRTIVEKPSVTEWDGVSMPAVSAPATAESTPSSLPSADRLAAALARSRSASADPTRAERSRPAIVLLPPPPHGLGGGQLGNPTTAPTISPLSTQGTPEARTVDRSDGGPAAPRPAFPAAGRPTPAAVPSPPPRPAVGTTTMKEYRLPQAAPPALPTARATATGTHPDRSPPASSPARLPERTTAPSPGLPADARPGGTPSTSSAPGAEPPATGGSKGRVRAWICPNCRLTNAPWSDHCTRCRAAAPSV